MVEAGRNSILTRDLYVSIYVHISIKKSKLHAGLLISQTQGENKDSLCRFDSNAHAE
jgi:hypothetical protein